MTSTQTDHQCPGCGSKLMIVSFDSVDRDNCRCMAWQVECSCEFRMPPRFSAAEAECDATLHSHLAALTSLAAEMARLLERMIPPPDDCPNHGDCWTCDYGSGGIYSSVGADATDDNSYCDGCDHGPTGGGDEHECRYERRYECLAGDVLALRSRLAAVVEAGEELAVLLRDGLVRTTSWWDRSRSALATWEKVRG